MSEDQAPYEEAAPEGQRSAPARSPRWRVAALPAALGAVAGMAVALATTATVAPSLGGQSDLSEVAVTFDTARYVNARRAAADQMLGEDADRGEVVSSLASADNNVKQLLQEKADGRLVLVRQAVVMEEQLPDMTEEVLKELGLPTDAPTVGLDPEVAADTNYRHSQTYEQARSNVEKSNEQTRAGMDDRDKEELHEWLP